jgi:DNA topoisomerase-2
MKSMKSTGIVDAVYNYVNFRNNSNATISVTRKSDTVRVPKLDDANNAGTKKSLNCTLILTEGDSAKSLAISGLAVVGRDNYGVFPLKGKLLNVREADAKKIQKNQEIQNIIKIVGINKSVEYDSSNIHGLRYGSILIMADQDHDGSHIKGLLINFLEWFNPSLLKVNGFLKQFITPIVKATKGREVKSFFTLHEYKQWKEEVEDAGRWKIKYYKGLGTSTSKEAKEYFSNLQTHVKDFSWQHDASSDIDMAFNKKKADERKVWMQGE